MRITDEGGKMIREGFEVRQELAPVSPQKDLSSSIMLA
jgi:hypothetical protein